VICLPSGDLTPELSNSKNFRIASNAPLIGDVDLHKQASVWLGADMRAESFVQTAIQNRAGLVQSGIE